MTVALQRHDPGFMRVEKAMAKKQMPRKAHETWWAWRRRLSKRGVDLPEKLCEDWSRWSWDPHFHEREELEEELRSLPVES
jgi:hypothetical protein